MPLQFIFGPSGSGKSHYLYKHIIEEAIRCPRQNFIVLVPEQFTMQTQKDFVSAHPCKGIMNIDVLSFGRLAYRVFEETGAGSLPVLDDEGKNLILRKIAVNCEEELKILKGNMKKLGYISEVKSVISEFTQYDIGQEELEKVMETVGEGSRLYYKLRDIQILYRAFAQYLKEKYITKEELLDVLSKVAGESQMLRNSTVVLDGFTGFTPVQDRLLRELMKYCRDVKITVTMEENEDPYTYKHPYQLFAISKQMVSSLVNIAKAEQTEILEPIQLFGKPVYRFRRNEAFAFLEKQLFRHEHLVYEQEQESLSIHVARNPKEECQAAAARIRELVRTHTYRYRDIGVIASNMDVYADYLRRAFALYDIPIFMDHKQSILLNAFVEYIRSVLNMAEQGFSYESVFRFLRTDMSGFLPEETDELENYVMGLGIKGYRRWQEKWIRRLKGMNEEAVSRMNHIRVAFVEKVDGLMFTLRQRKKTVKDITAALYEFLVKEEAQLKLKKREQEFLIKGELALAKEYAQIYRIVLELFDKFVLLLGEEPVSLTEYCKLLDAGLEEAKVGVIPPSVDQVVAGDVERTRLKDIKVLIFLGANDNYLPGALGRQGLLTERDRQQFSKEKLVLSPGGKEKAYIQKFYLYMNLTKPSELLEIYYSKVSLEGKSIRPAYLIQEIRKLYPKLKVIEEEERSIYHTELTERVALRYLTEGLQKLEKQSDGTFWELLRWYKQMGSWEKKLHTLLDARFLTREQEVLGREQAEKLYGESFQDSITRMERYAACPYAHFLAYGLGLSERQEYDFKSVDMGNICHAALEKYAKKTREEKTDWVAVEEQTQKQWIAESVEEAVTDYGNAILYSTARHEYMVSRMKRMLEVTVWALTRQLAAGDFKPSEHEHRFAHGKIDRIDICEAADKVYVKVLDYKTGAKAFDVVSLYHGLQLQLMVYMGAAAQLKQKQFPDKEVIPAGVFYYQIQDPIVDKAEQDIEQALLKKLKVDGIINLKDEVLARLDRNVQEESLVVPIKLNKNGSLAKSSKALQEEDFNVLLEYAVKKVAGIHKEITEGNAPVHPYRKGQESGCDYCKYHYVCGFDTKIPGYAFREIDKMSKEEALAAMKGEQEE